MSIQKRKLNFLMSFGLLLISTFCLWSVTLQTAFSAEKVTKQNLKQKIETAVTPSDHRAISDFYLSEAAAASKKATEHEQMASLYKNSGGGSRKIPYAPGTTEHCEKLVKEYKALANEYTALAKDHEAMAAKAK